MKVINYFLIVFLSYLAIPLLNAQHIGDFKSVNPNGRNATLNIPETHTFQKLIQNGNSMTGGVTFNSVADFTGYVPINGSSINGYLSINNESNNGGVAMLDINFNQNTKLWNVTNSKYVDFSAYGRTSRNCSGTVTPWGTIITSEEVGTTYNDVNNDGYYDYGWQVEIDPKTKQVIDKCWAMGRFAHENAVVHKNWRTVYQGADSGSGHLYKFVADFPGDLSSGKLYAYKGSKTGGSGQWLLIPNSSKYEKNNTQDYAQDAGATTFAGVEDVEIGPDGLVYFAVKNEHKIYYFEDSDPINGTTVPFLNKFAGKRNYSIPTENGNVNHYWGYGNDNLAFDTEGNLWVLQDGENSHIWVVRKGHTETKPKVEIFGTTPSGSEPTGITFSPDGRFAFLSIQHPSGFTYQKDAAGDNIRFNTDATIVIARKEFLGSACQGSACSTCEDGIQNFAEIEVDCGGPCHACETCNDRIKNNNETGIDCGPGCVSCPTLNVTKTDITCKANNKGSAIAEVTGGSGNITYLWSTGDTTVVANNLSAGNYSVKISDKNGNTQQQNFTISQSQALSVSYAVTQVSSSNASNGAVNLTVSGGKSPYTYDWSNNATIQDINNLTSGSYSVSVTDNNGCTIFTNVDLAVLDCTNFEVELAAKNIVCRGNGDGTITALTSGGTAPFSYSWSNGGNSQTIENLNAGNYSVTVTDDNGCSVSNASPIVQSIAVLNITLNTTGTTALNASDGASIAAVTGGQSPYTYKWSTGGASPQLSNLKKGTYDLVVTDANGCEAFETAVIDEYECDGSLSASLSATDVKCFGDSNGIISASVTGGNTPYAYKWSNGSSAAGLALLKQGNYSLSITDANGCKANSDVLVNQPAPIELEHVYANPTNSLSTDGSASVSVTGGIGTYAYNWSAIIDSISTTMIDSSSIDSLAAGIYKVEVADENGCLANKTISILPYKCDSLNVALNKTNVLCAAVGSGSIASIVTGGLAPITYLWNTGENSADITGLSGNTYSVEITDSLGCLYKESVTIYETNTPLKLNTESVALTTMLQDNGAAYVSVEGGVPPFSYNWSNGNTTNSITNLAAGNYTIEVTDDNGCSVSEPVTVASVNCSDLKLDIIDNGATCGKANGFLLADVEGGLAPITYSWSDGSITSYLKDKPAGNYQLSVTDARGCSESASKRIRNIAGVSVSVNGNDLSAYNSNNGSASLSANGGQSPYTYLWSTGATGTTINNLTPGSYEVLVTDINGCTAKDEVQIDNVNCSANNFKAAIIFEDVNCKNGDDGYIKVVPSGGNSPYSYSWADSNTSNSTRSNLSSGNYSVTVIDSKNCKISSVQTIREPSSNLSASVSKTNETQYNLNDGTATVQAAGGEAPYTYVWSTGGGGKTINDLPGGSYSVEVIDANGCASTKSFSVTGISCNNISMAVNKTDALCFDTPTGVATASISGGNLPYHISWTNNGTGNIANNLKTGIYEGYVVDNVGCTAYQSFTIEEPTDLLFSVVKTDITYFGADDGTINLNVTNGTPPYIYDWSDGSSSGTLNNLMPGSYTVNIMDSNGCEENALVIITDINCNALNINSLSVTDVSCFGENDGRVTSQINGGNTPYTYSWSNGSSSSTISGLSGGTYTLNITGNKGCKATKTATVFEPTKLVVNLNKSDESLYGELDGFANITISGGQPNYQINWSNGSTSSGINNLTPGNYSVSVADSNQCLYEEDFTITQGCRLPYNLQANSTSATTAIVNWQGDVTDASYNIQYRNVTDGGGWQTSTLNQSSTILANLRACKTYEVGIFGNCEPFMGSFILFKTDGCTNCGAINNLYTINETKQSAFLNWDITPGASYTLYYRKKGASSWSNYETNFSFAILFNLDECSEYQWLIKANCVGGGTSPNSSIKQFNTLCFKNSSTETSSTFKLIQEIYPNPTVDWLHINYQLKKSQPIDIEIYSADGQMQYKKEYTTNALQNTIQVDVNELPTGLYTIYLKSESGLESSKFIKE